MFASILVTVIILAILAAGFRSERRGGLISRRPYNNPYSDASGARDGR